MTTDLIGYGAAVLTTSAFLPQAWLTIKTRNTSSLSLGMYSLFTAGILLWLVYGLLKNDLALIVANICTLLFAVCILGFKIYNLIRKID